jgi:hypothetical protein
VVDGGFGDGNGDGGVEVSALAGWVGAVVTGAGALGSCLIDA